MKLTGHEGHARGRVLGHRRHVGLRAENTESSRGVAKKMASAIEKAGTDTVAGDCHLANSGIVQETGRCPCIPLQLVARAYGIPEETDEPELAMSRKLTLADIADLRGLRARARRRSAITSSR